MSKDVQIYQTSHLVDGYKKAFVDASLEADAGFTPRFVSNSGNKTVRDIIIDELKDCRELFMSVAFITSGGLKPFLGYLKELEKKNIKGRILTTDYLMFSDPKALNTLDSLKNLEVRMYRTEETGVGFHTKGYLFHHDNGDLRILVGSSNLTQNAISRNHEWNTMLVSKSEGKYAQDIESEFNEIWNSSVSYSECKDEYEKEYKEKTHDRELLKKLTTTLDLSTSKVVEPNQMQAEFSYNIEHLVSSGQKRALLISATGTGKTFASALAIRNLFAKELLRSKKILFLSHREQINKQALESYKRVFGKGFSMELLSGTNQDINRLRAADFVFSTMQMLIKDDVREKLFTPDYFSIIVLDECHRTGSEGYQKIISYFKPEFLLGMSASLERGDGFDIYKQFDHNIACEIRLQTALENDLLCPFHYFGIQDLVIDENPQEIKDFKRLTSDERVRQIIKAAEYYGYSGECVRGLIFCSKKDEAKELSDRFNETGLYKTVFLCGETPQVERERAIGRLTAPKSDPNRLDYIFTVDIFNEGVDIPEINQVIMLRPTESAIIFVQQLGRGLRKSAGKEYVVIIDFIANYDNNYLIPIALYGDRTGNKDNIRRQLMEGNAVLKGASSVYFDEVSKSKIFASIDKAQMNKGALLKEEYLDLKHKLGRRPKLSEFDKYQALDPMRIINYIGSYHDFLVKYDELENTYDSTQQEFMNFICEKFACGKRIHEIEMLQVILDGSSDIVSDWKNVMLTKHSIIVRNITLDNVLNVMSGVFYAIGANKEKYARLAIIKKGTSGQFEVSSAFAQALSNSQFRSELADVLEFASERYMERYSSRQYGSEFVVGQKYTYEDVCRLLCWEKNEVSLNIGGYKYDERTKTYPVFINYSKSEDISDTIRYEDRFTDNSHLIAISKSKRTPSSPDVVSAVNSIKLGIQMELFVRKNKDDKESKEFYYLGPIQHSGFLKQFVMPGTNATAVEIGYQLSTPVEPNLFSYLTSEIM